MLLESAARYSSLNVGTRYYRQCSGSGIECFFGAYRILIRYYLYGYGSGSFHKQAIFATFEDWCKCTYNNYRNKQKNCVPLSLTMYLVQSSVIWVLYVASQVLRPQASSSLRNRRFFLTEFLDKDDFVRICKIIIITYYLARKCTLRTLLIRNKAQSQLVLKKIWNKILTSPYWIVLIKP